MINFRAKARILSKYKFKIDVKYFEKNYLNWLVIENSGGLCKSISGQIKL